MSKTKQIWPASLAILIISIACLGSTLPTVVPNAVDTIVAATMAAITPVYTLTPITTPTPFPTPTSFPTFTSTFVIPTLPPVGSTLVPPAATRINFLPETTTGVVSGSIQPGQSQYFVLNASLGQPLIVMVNSLNNDVTLSIRTQGGTWMVNPAAHLSNFQSMLPKTEDYYIGVYGGDATENFTLTVEIPSRIKFAPGADTAMVSGKTVAGYDVAFTVLAVKGQVMRVYLNGVGKDGALTIYGYSDGQPYVRSVTEQTTFGLKLPVTQDYIILVVPRSGKVIFYTLIVNIK
jgi:hypothetical protein